MSISRFAIEKPLHTWLLMLLCFLGGLWGLNSVGRLEDPAFTIKQAIIFTPYPGATALEVEKEVTEVIESATQQLSQLDEVTSKSMPGMSEVTVEMKSTFDGTEMPQIWDELRRKINDVQADLPQGAKPSIVNDDFGDVYGLFYAVTAPDFTDAQKRHLATFLRRELLTVPGVAKVTTAGEPTETIYVEISNKRLASLGIPIEQVISTLNDENTVIDAGSLRLDDQRVRFNVEPSLSSVDAISNVRIGVPGTTEQISIIDIADVKRVPTELPDHLTRFNGERSFTLAIAGVGDANIVEVGQAVEDKLSQIKPRIPLGATLHPIYEQHKVVDQSIDDFMVNLASSVAIVIGVLCLFMGWRMGVVVGVTLFLTVMGTVFFMGVFDIEMERISLGALIIAMGMLVDNAIVIAEGMLINLEKGMGVRASADDAAGRTQIPLLGATVIGIMAFAGIGLSPDATGEFLFSLFAVIGISLILSWILAITVTPLLGSYLLKEEAKEHMGEDVYGGRIYRFYKRLLKTSLRLRFITISALFAITIACFYGFGFVKQSFFPDSNTPLFFVNYTLPQGTDIHATYRDISEMEAAFLEQDEVVSVASFVGRGASRFMLTYAPEQANTAYGQLIIRTSNRAEIDPLIARMMPKLTAAFPNGLLRSERLVFGPGGGAKIEARFSGEDPAVLRGIAQQVENIFHQSPALKDIRHDWRQRELVLTPQIQTDRARMAGVNRADVAQTLAYASTGVQAGTYRERDQKIPIIARAPADERGSVDQLKDRLIWSTSASAFIPMSQIATGFTPQMQEVLIRRRDRVRTLTVQADPVGDMTPASALSTVRHKVEAIDLPQGYRLEWGGEYESSKEANESLGGQLPIAFLTMLIISILLFGKLRQPLVIWLVVPMAICGVCIGLLVTGLPFSFTALLGLLSLSGMLMKNAIVLVDEIDQQRNEQESYMSALIDGSVSRLRPVFLAAVTTILGMLPLLSDAFFASMAVTIMGGLAFATILTLVAVPVFYDTFFNFKRQRS